MLWKEFKEAYYTASTWKDEDEILALLTPEQLTDFVTTLEKVNDMTGLDMRQIHFLATARAIIHVRAEQKQQEIEAENKYLGPLGCPPKDIENEEHNYHRHRMEE